MITCVNDLPRGMPMRDIQPRRHAGRADDFDAILDYHRHHRHGYTQGQRHEVRERVAGADIVAGLAFIERGGIVAVTGR